MTPLPIRLIVTLAAALCVLAAAACGGDSAATPTTAPAATGAPTAAPASTPAAPTAIDPTPPPAVGPTAAPAPDAIPAATGAPAPSDAPTPTAAPAADATPAPTAAVAQPVTPYDPTATMYRLFPELGYSKPDTEQALDDILREKDTSQVPVLIESLRFFFDADTQEQAAAALRELTGQDFDPREWDKWMEWYGANRELYRPPEGYAAWKTNLLSGIDDRYTELLADAGETARIDLTEVTWGGVVIDGIPDLRNPNVLPADGAAYLQPRDRVFGVSINGEHRAYPLRITNPHEMVNDVLGGEPIALAW